MPCVARDWKVSDDGRAVTIYLRKGMKWSDGHPFTTNDFLFWYEDVYLNKDIQATPNPDFMIGGKPGTMRKVDDVTLVFEFPDPNYLFLDILAGSTAMGGGMASQTWLGRTMGAYMPGHYLKQFLPKYVSKDELDKKVKESGLDGWVTHLKNRWEWRAQPRPADPDPLEDGLPQQHAQLGARAEPVLLRGRHAGQPASLHRPDQHGARGEPGGPEPPSHRGPVRPPGAPHGHGQAARLPGEPGQGQLRRAARPRAQRLGRHAPGQPRLRGRPRDRQVAPQSRLPARAVDGHRARPAQRDLLAGGRRSRLRRAVGDGAVQPGRRVAQEVVDP